MTDVSRTNGKITRTDIENKLHEMRGEVEESAEAAKTPIMAIAGGAGGAGPA